MLGQLSRMRAGNSALKCKSLHRIGSYVAHVHRETFAQQIACDTEAHGTQTNHSDVLHAVLKEMQSRTKAPLRSRRHQ